MKLFFFVSYWNLVLFNVFDFKVLQTHLKCLKWTVSRDFLTLLFCLKDSTWARHEDIRLQSLKIERPHG